MAITLSILLAVVLVMIGIPFWVSLGLATAALLWSTGVMPMQLIGEALFEGVDSFALIAIPLFVLTGDVMVRSGLAYRLLDFAEASFGSFRSGFGTATVMGCGLFACISGSDAADAAAIGRITMDRLQEKGYPKPYACALVAAGACTGILIPPSIAYIIIGLVLGVSSATLFQAAFVPGVMILGAVMVTNALVNRMRGYERSTGRFALGTWLAALNGAKWALLIPFIILGGIYSGIFTPTESAAVAAFVALVIGMLQGRITLGDFPAMLGASARVCGVVLPIIAVALLFAQALTVVDVPQKFVAWMMAFAGSIPLVDTKSAVILMMLAIWVVAGCFMETGPNIVVLGPLMLPLAKQIGMDPIHFCVFMITTLGLGFITPPFGLNLFVMSGLTRTPVTAIAAQALPFVAAMIFVSLIIGFVPAISLFTLK
jgi:C4-dicarboxylate transporter, DctM subunit